MDKNAINVKNENKFSAIKSCSKGSSGGDHDAPAVSGLGPHLTHTHTHTEKTYLKTDSHALMSAKGISENLFTFQFPVCRSVGKVTSAVQHLRKIKTNTGSKLEKYANTAVRCNLWCSLNPSCVTCVV